MERACVCVYLCKQNVLIEIYMDSLTLNLQTTTTTTTNNVNNNKTAAPVIPDATMFVFLKLKCHSITIFRVAIKCGQNHANKGAP